MQQQDFSSYKYIHVAFHYQGIVIFFVSCPSWRNHGLITSVDCVSLLGLNIDSTLSFNAHADKVCKKLASRIAILRKIRTYLPLPQRIQYYNSIISPVMSYVSAIWSNCDKELLYRVFKLQLLRKLLKSVANGTG